MNTQTIIAAVEAVHAALLANEQHIESLDRAIGDGDHFINVRRGMPGRLQDPADIDAGAWTAEDRAAVGRILHYAVAGGPDTVRAGIERFVQLTGVDELMLTTHVYDHEARKRSFEIVATLRAAMAA